MYSLNTGDDAGAASFCVSNRMYMRHRRGYNATNPDKAPTMNLEDTQIPAACAYITGIPSQGRVAALEHFVLFKVPMLLSIVQMSCSKSTEARIEHVTKIIDKAIKVLHLLLNRGNELISVGYREAGWKCCETELQDISERPYCRDLKP